MCDDMAKNILVALMMCLASLGVSAADRVTEVYDVVGTDTLRLDFYRAQSDTLAPAMIFAFGGGFKGGQRDHESFMPMFEYLTRNGISVVSVDYRTMLGRVSAADMMSPEGFKSNLIAAIDTAVTDFLSATAYVVNRKAREWEIDPGKIFACGSSAGAITVLQTEYDICNGDEAFLTSYALPESFNYAGVIAMAGAICSQGSPRWGTTPCPLLMFHGDADAIVPFDQAVLGDFGLWGSNAVSTGLAEGGIPHRFHRVNGASHEVSGTPMSRYCGEIYDFIKSVCRNEEKSIVNTTEYIPGQPPYKTDFTIIDYIKANM